MRKQLAEKSKLKKSEKEAKEMSLEEPIKLKLKNRFYFMIIFPLLNIHLQKLRIKKIKEWDLVDWFKATISFIMLSLVSWFGTRLTTLDGLFYLIGTLSLVLALCSLYMIIQNIDI